MKHIKPFNELKSETYFSAAKKVGKLSNNRTNSNRIKTLNTKGLETKYIENRKKWEDNIELYKKYGLFEFEFNRTIHNESKLMKGYIKFDLFTEDNDEFGIKYYFNIRFMPENLENFVTLYDEYLSTDRKCDNGSFLLFTFNFAIELYNDDMEFEINVEDINFEKPYEAIPCNSSSRAESNRLRRYLLSLFTEDTDYELEVGKNIYDKFLDFLIVHSSEYGIELSHIRDAISKSLSPSCFLNI